MKITITECKQPEDEEIIIKCVKVDEDLMRLIRKIRNDKEKLTVFSGEKMQQVEVANIYYFEAVDDRVFAYFEKEVFEVKLRLYELEAEYTGTVFFRASKSILLNLNRVKNFTPAFNGKVDACMKNGEHLMISRSFVPELKRKLNLTK